ncbi:MAG TPA: cytochrome c, partial [Trueperaceae bacterium]
MTYRRRLLSVLPPLALGALLLLVAYAQQAQTGGAGGQQSLQQKMAQGQQIYTQAGCVGCHGSQGQGQSGVGPALAGNQHIRNPQAQIAQILHGGGGMPAFGGRLSNQQIAQVATYERNSWGNDFGEIQAQQVAA